MKRLALLVAIIVAMLFAIGPPAAASQSNTNDVQIVSMVSGVTVSDAVTSAMISTSIDAVSSGSAYFSDEASTGANVVITLDDLAPSAVSPDVTNAATSYVNANDDTTGALALTITTVVTATNSGFWDQLASEILIE